MRERGQGRERGQEIWQITLGPGFVCVSVQECAKHGLFVLPARKGEISALPPGRNEEAFGKAAAEGKPEGVHSFTSFADPLALSWKEPFAAWVLPLPLCLPGTAQPSPAPPWVCSGASRRGQQGIQASPSLGSPRLAFPQHFTHSSSPKRNVP